MLAGLVILVPIVVLVGFSVWAFYYCRSRTAAEAARRQSLPSTDVESSSAEILFPEESRPCLEFLDGYFERGPVILGGSSGNWGLTRHLTRFHHRYLRSPQVHIDEKPHW